MQVAGRALAERGAVQHVERGGQRCRAVPRVVMAVRGELALGQR